MAQGCHTLRKSGSSGNFQIIENLKETQGDSGKFLFWIENKIYLTQFQNLFRKVSLFLSSYLEIFLPLRLVIQYLRVSKNHGSLRLVRKVSGHLGKIF